MTKKKQVIIHITNIQVTYRTYFAFNELKLKRNLNEEVVQNERFCDNTVKKAQVNESNDFEN